mmetsp:Transcript_107381/g.342110  ORF Transcript_107381/g.342110 Transcript_107381/m.342110 type:complete len:297 (-) Transcript_107381:658-1548(-)
MAAMSGSCSAASASSTARARSNLVCSSSSAGSSIPLPRAVSSNCSKRWLSSAFTASKAAICRSERTACSARSSCSLCSAASRPPRARSLALHKDSSRACRSSSRRACCTARAHRPPSRAAFRASPKRERARPDTTAPLASNSAMSSCRTRGACRVSSDQGTAERHRQRASSRAAVVVVSRHSSSTCLRGTAPLSSSAAPADRTEDSKWTSLASPRMSMALHRRTATLSEAAELWRCKAREAASSRITARLERTSRSSCPTLLQALRSGNLEAANTASICSVWRSCGPKAAPPGSPV